MHYVFLCFLLDGEINRDRFYNDPFLFVKINKFEINELGSTAAGWGSILFRSMSLCTAPRLILKFKLKLKNLYLDDISV